MKTINPNPDELRIFNLIRSKDVMPNITLSFKQESSARIMETSFGVTNEGFRIIYGEPVQIIYASLRALSFALVRLVEDSKTGILESNIEGGREIFDYPRFNLRGIIEGFYGRPWGPEVRRAMIRMIPEMRMNSFFYGPKDDPYHRELWSELYPDKELAEICELRQLCTEQDTDLWYGIGPGLSMSYSSADHRAELCNKLFQLYDAGIKHFGLYLDDIPEQLQHPEDRAAYSDLVEAHISLINEVYNRLKARDQSIKLAVCPTPYWGEPGYYISRLSAGIDYRIMIFHTGPEICSARLSLHDAAIMMQITDRPVLYWDNYPVNDLEMSHRLHIGPYNNRDPHLYRVSSGLVANGMEYAEASKIPFLTIGDYLWNPETYNPEESFRAAVKRIVGERDFDSFFPFADNNRASCLCPNDSTQFRERIEAFGYALKDGRPDAAVGILAEELNRLDKPVLLFSKGMQNSRLENEIRPWAGQYCRAVSFLHQVLDILKSPMSLWPKLLLQLEKAGLEYSTERWYVFSDVMSSFIREIIPGLKFVLKQGEENE